MGTRINGRELAETMQVEIKKEVEELAEKNIQPGLAVLLVGEDPASQVYVRNKETTAKKLGIYSQILRYEETITEKQLLEEIKRLNGDPKIHGILVQLPLPKQIDEEKVILTIDPKKDVDGFHPVNMGKLLTGDATMIPCTPYGIMKMLEAYSIDVDGKQAVVVGRSNIVGKPVACLLLEKNATVTVTHSHTQDLKAITSQADILVVAIGKGHFITKDYVKDGAVVIDVGMNRNAQGKLIGDVKFDEVEPKTSYITPVPKGVGPMTITMLMQQTVKACKIQELGL
ncbi:MAG TPA: bifunctional methylenetetrahydrofolate dehydrogenase/methenyltetrahydrofolate cyclohydrolase [Candidatus Tetragenococcus pullicola]|nr:bifunctional methylenetetrahydrofolate dehydrogenase/methenyltetrahydrofolate cyclohydrolase [Candidatus Tetragenococcus pullicola]